MKSFDKVILRDVCAAANIGVSEEERSDRQNVSFDVELHLDLSLAAANDDLSLTPDYLRVVNALREIAQERHYRLLETMAEAAAKLLLDQFSIERVVLRVRKEKIHNAHGIFNASVEITRPNHA